MSESARLRTGNHGPIVEEELRDKLQVDLKPAQFSAVDNETTEILVELFHDMNSRRVLQGLESSK